VIEEIKYISIPKDKEQWGKGLLKDILRNSCKQGDLAFGVCPKRSFFVAGSVY